MRFSYVLVLSSTLFIVFASSEDEWKKFKQRFARNEIGYKSGVNKFADISETEFRQSSRVFHVDFKFQLNEDNTDCGNDTLPDAYDYREEGAITAVKDGRIYNEEGFGWAFVVSGAIEAQVYLSKKTLVPLSAQQLIDCVNASKADETLWGGKLDFVYDYIFSNNGIYTEEEYPYTETIGTCADDRDDKGTAPTLLLIFSDECGIKSSLVQLGPVTVMIDASGLANYESGIVDGTQCSNEEKDANHAVLIVGYGKEEDTEYWIVKNSWGSDWGEDGYFRLARLKNACGVGISPSVPII